jgi:Xaa-Pro aminopeptidase
MDRHQPRRERLGRAVNKAGAQALLVTHPANVTYLTGFTGEDSYLLFSTERAIVLSDPRFTTQLGEECPGLDLYIRRPGATMLQAIARVLRSARVSRLGIEADSMSVALREQIATERPRMEILPTSGLVETLRQIKDQEEVARIRRAVWQAEKALAVLRSTLRPDKTEKQIAAELEYQMRLFGAKGCSFSSIVGVGSRAALPHATPGNHRVGQSDFVLLDWGANEELYNSDLTRVLVTGKISPRFERVYQTVLQAQTRAIAAIRPGASTRQVDRVARTAIAKAGFGRYFGHGLGHGLGLAVHEAPRLAANSDTPLKPGMVITVEPGIYLPGWGGVRIEDDVLVTRQGHEVLTSAPKQIEEVVVC